MVQNRISNGSLDAVEAGRKEVCCQGHEVSGGWTCLEGQWEEGWEWERREGGGRGEEVTRQAHEGEKLPGRCRWRRTESRPTPNELMVNQGRVRPGRGGKDEDGREKECGED